MAAAPGTKSYIPEKCMMQRSSLPISKPRLRIYQTGARQGMATVQLSPRVVADLEGILKFIANRDPVLAAITNVREAVQILARHPLVDARRRELIHLEAELPSDPARK
jgi:hypothetical protein